MKFVRIFLAMVTIVTLIAIDSQAAGEDGLQYYGHALRSLVWLIIAANGIVFYEGVRALAIE